MSPAAEVNFDGLVGPTHNYAGLSAGNLASMSHRGTRSNPRAAALQGLAKMKRLADLGVPQAVLPPHERPALATLRALGFTGREPDVLRAAARTAPALLAACASASNMWVANAATVSPSADTPDGRVHFTPANLASKFHRAIEPAQTARTLRAIFRDATRFVVHEPVPAGGGCGDEGAANHTRLTPRHGARGLHLFVYGHRAFSAGGAAARPTRFASRQAFEASAAVARAHGLSPQQVVYARQHPAAIDAGVFHNDVIAVGNEQVLLYHENAFVDSRGVIAALRRTYGSLHPGRTLTALPVPARRVSLRQAVRTYLFNSQLVTTETGGMVLVAPADCEEERTVKAFLDDLLTAPGCPLRAVQFVDLRESMRNGGGPACLRLRVVLTAAERNTLPPGVFLTPSRYDALVAWVKRHYRDRLEFSDLADPALLEESRRALDQLTTLLGLGPIYDFQR
ncbi:MAG: N-succinylarginine dihydrolase [Opitutaceae bacterium]|nr:N-succinylarginine dihydrolase [Opitutaceae bacterium]